MRDALAIVNPAAGGGTCGKEAQGALDSLRNGHMKLKVVETTGPGDATQLAKEAFANGTRHFIAVGGDGTSCEIVNGFMDPSLETGELCTLGFLPFGTGNSYLRDFTQHGTGAALNALKEDRSRPSDVNALHHDGGIFYSLNILSMGFTARVGATTNQRFKRFGELGYVMGVVTTLAGLESDPFAMTVDGVEEEEKALTFLSLNNSQYTGGKMRMAPNASTEDGLCEMIEVGKMGRFRLLQLFPRIFKGAHIHAPEVESRRAKEIVFRGSGPMDVMADGEIIRVVPRKVKVIQHAFRVNI